MAFKMNFSSGDESFDTNFSTSDSEHKSSFGSYHTVYDGENGATFYPNVSNNGDLSWTNDRGLPNPPSVNIKGEKGDKGDQGERGVQGIQGIQGERGYKGDKGDKGDRGEQGIQGIQGVKGDKGDKGDTGTQGANGKDGADGFSPIVSLSKSGKVTTLEITDKNGKKTAEILDGVDGQGGGGGKAIIDVVELPTENIDEDSFYRLLTGSFVFNQYVQNGYTCYCVESLPEVGEPATNADMSTIVAYYNVTDGELYGYVDAMLSQFFGVPSGWYPAAMLFQAAGVPYSGIITDILDDPMDNTYRLALEYVVWQYKGKWVSLKSLGWTGVGNGAEVFNLPWNMAYGAASHAEGRGTIAGVFGEDTYGQHAEGFETTASGNASHAEGRASHAKGDYSHAEGNSSHAEGESSHAEGNSSHAEGESSHAEGGYSRAEGGYSHAEGNSSHTVGQYSHAEGYASYAEGNSSHAEGNSSHAEGYVSHAEGYHSHAVGRSQHAQGEFNIIDPEYNANNPHIRAKYVNIVGNGADESNRSNAHTLDWNGLGWFAGGLKVGGTGQDDESAEEIPTKSQVQAMIDEAIAKLQG